MAKRILITGASGLLGVNLALEMVQSCQVFGTAHDRTLAMENVAFRQANLLEPGMVAQLLDWAQPDWIVHCAALANVDLCEQQPDLARRLNADLPGELADAARQRGARLVHISTDAVFDGRQGNYRETDAPNPPNVYAQTKLDAERAVLAAYPDAIVARVNFFGWSMTGDRSLAEFFFNKLSTGELANGFEDVYSCPLLVNDLAQLLRKMLEKDLHGLYHVTSSECLSKYEFGMRLARQFGLDETLITPISVAQAGLAAPRSPNLTMNVNKLASALGEDIPTVSSGLHRLYRLYQQGYPQMLQRLLAAS